MSKKELRDVVKLRYATPENAVFEEKRGFVSLTFRPEDGEEKTYDRVKLQRNFPNSTPDGYLSVLDSEDNEICIIRDVEELGEETAALLRRETARRYYVFTIKRILSVNQRYGFSYWKVEAGDGVREFTVQDTYRSFRKLGADRAAVTDVDGNRYEIPSLSGLDRRSMKKIELYI